jgi:Fe-S cluster assembly protein SufD
MKKLNTIDIKNKVETLQNTYKILDDSNEKIVVKENETITIIDTFTKEIEIEKELIVEKNATLNYIKIGNKDISMNIKYLNTIGENATLNMTLVEQGDSNNSIQTELLNSDSLFTINGLIDIKDKSKVAYDIQTKHAVKSISDISFRNLLDDKSFAKISIFSKVERSAIFSKAFQNSKTILLSEDSAVTVTPHLEISIDELEASHGATCGDLDKDSLYYLQSRGIMQTDAKQMLLNAIRNEVYDKLENEELVEYIKGLI